MRALALTAAVMMAAPQSGGAGSRTIWAGFCDAAHPGTQVPIPLDQGGDRAPAKACHAACSTLPERRARR